MPDITHQRNPNIRHYPQTDGSGHALHPGDGPFSYILASTTSNWILSILGKTNPPFVSLRAAAIVGLLLVAAITVGAKCEGRFSGGTDDFTEERLETVITIGRSDAEYGITLTALAAYIAEIGFGFQVEVVPLAAGEVQAALESGQVDLVMNAGQPDNSESLQAAVSTGTIFGTGTTYVDDDDFPVTGATSLRLGEIGADFLSALQKMEIPLSRVDETDTWWRENGIEGEFRAALYFLWNFNYEDSWKSWMPWNPAERLRDKTERFTGVRYPERYLGIEYDLRGHKPIQYDENGTPIPDPESEE